MQSPRKGRRERKDRRSITQYQKFPVQRFRIPSSPPPVSLTNKRLGSHWTEHMELTEQYKHECGWEFKLQRSRWMLDHGPITGAFAIHIHIGWEAGRWPDLDASVIAIKALIDSLRDVGIIGDDRQMEFYSLTREPVASDVGFVDVELRPYRQGDDS